MSTQDQYVQLSSLPDNVRKQVLEFIDFLMKREQRRNETPEEPVRKKPIAGLMKGQIWTADDFDAPLDDFKEYM